MSIRTLFRWWVVACFAVVAGGCADILGYPGYEFRETGGAAGAGAGGAGGAGAAGAASGAGGSAGTGAGGSTPCSEATCVATECVSAICDNNVCVKTNEPDGKLVDGLAIGDCKKRVCAAGMVTDQADDGDLPADPLPSDCRKKVCAAGMPIGQNDDMDKPISEDPCKEGICTEGVPGFIPAPDGKSCGAGLICSGGVCMGCGMDKSKCDPDTPCHSFSCPDNECIRMNMPNNTLIEPLPLDDCKKTVCIGGEITTVGAPEEMPPTDNNICTADECNADGTPGYPATNQGATCELAGVCSNESLCDAGQCKKHPKPAGTLTPNNQPGDCQVKMCNGAGVEVSVADDTDNQSDNNVTDCKIPSCMGGYPVPGGINKDDGDVCNGNTPFHCCNGICCPEPNYAVCINNACCPANRACNGGTVCCDSGYHCPDGFNCEPKP